MSTDTPVDLSSEKQVLNYLNDTWLRCAANQGLPKKGDRRAEHFFSFLQGSLTALVLVGVLTEHRVGVIAFMTSVRGEEGFRELFLK